MTNEEAYRYIDNLKWLKGYDNTKIGGKPVGEILDEIKVLLKEQEAQIEKLTDQIDAITKWRANAGAFD